MKRRPSITLIILAVSGVAASHGAKADEFTIGWYNIDSSGAPGSTGGDFALSGTVGQADAGALAGGAFTLTGGYEPGADPGQDCNVNGIPDVWDLFTGTSADCNSNAIPDECDIASGTSADCNVNAIPDSCDMAGGTSPDCNTNAIPDECDIAGGTSADCNANTVPDACDVAGGTSPDCNTNAIPDECDIAGGTSADCDANTIPDFCDIVDGGRPLPEDRFDIDGTVRTCWTDGDCRAGLSADSHVDCVLPPLGGEGVCYVRKNRYISIDPNMATACTATARRVALDLDDNDVYDGGIDAILGWVGAPAELTIAGPEPTPQLLARIVDEATRHYRDWSVDDAAQPWTDATLHLGDCETSPGHTYFVQAIAEGHDINDEANYSAPLTLRTTGFYGDVTGSVVGAPPDGIRNFKDISAAVRGFQSLQAEPKVWLDLQGGTAAPEIPDFSDISFADINWAVKGFQGAEYPLAAPCDCPGQVCP